MISRSYHGNDAFADPNIVVFVQPPPAPHVTYLHAKNEGGGGGGGLNIFISNFVPLSQRTALNSQSSHSQEPCIRTGFCTFSFYNATVHMQQMFSENEMNFPTWTLVAFVPSSTFTWGNSKL